MNAECAGKTVRSLENACHTWAPKRCVHDEALYKCTFTFFWAGTHVRRRKYVFGCPWRSPKLTPKMWTIIANWTLHNHKCTVWLQVNRTISIERHRNTVAQECVFLEVCSVGNFLLGVQSRHRSRLGAIRRRNAKRRLTTAHAWMPTRQWITSAAGRWSTCYRRSSAAAGCRLHVATPDRPLLTSTSRRGTCNARWSEPMLLVWIRSSTSGSARTTNNQHETYCRSLVSR